MQQKGYFVAMATAVDTEEMSSWPTIEPSGG